MKKRSIVFTLVLLLVFNTFPYFSSASNVNKDPEVKMLDSIKNQSDPTIQVSDLTTHDGTKIGYSVKMKLPSIVKEIKKHENEAYDFIDVPGWASQPETGKPSVPIKPLFFEIPENVSPKITMGSKCESKFENVNLWPVQEALPDDEHAEKRNFTKDMKTYSQKEKFPQNNILI